MDGYRSVIPLFALGRSAAPRAFISRGNHMNRLSLAIWAWVSRARDLDRRLMGSFGSLFFSFGRGCS